jgi:hypothetical protein
MHADVKSFQNAAISCYAAPLYHGGLYCRCYNTDLHDYTHRFCYDSTAHVRIAIWKDHALIESRVGNEFVESPLCGAI